MLRGPEGRLEAQICYAPDDVSGTAVAERRDTEQLRRDSLQIIRDVITRNGSERMVSKRVLATEVIGAGVAKIPMIIVGESIKLGYPVAVTSEDFGRPILLIDFYEVTGSGTKRFNLPQAEAEGLHSFRQRTVFGDGERLQFGIAQGQEYIPLVSADRYGYLSFHQTVLPEGGFEALQQHGLSKLVPQENKPSKSKAPYVPTQPKEPYDPLDISKMVVPADAAPSRLPNPYSSVAVAGHLERGGKWVSGSEDSAVDKGARPSNAIYFEKKANGLKNNNGSKNNNEHGHMRTSGAKIEKKDGNKEFKRRR